MGGRLTSGFLLEPEQNTSAIVVLTGAQVFCDVESSFSPGETLRAPKICNWRLKERSGQGPLVRKGRTSGLLQLAFAYY